MQRDMRDRPNVTVASFAG